MQHDILDMLFDSIYVAFAYFAPLVVQDLLPNTLVDRFIIIHHFR